MFFAERLESVCSPPPWPANNAPRNSDARLRARCQGGARGSATRTRRLHQRIQPAAGVHRGHLRARASAAAALAHRHRDGGGRESGGAHRVEERTRLTLPHVASHEGLHLRLRRLEGDFRVEFGAAGRARETDGRTAPLWKEQDLPFPGRYRAFPQVPWLRRYRRLKLGCEMVDRGYLWCRYQ